MAFGEILLVGYSGQSRAGSYTMMAKPMKTLQLHYPVICYYYLRAGKMNQIARCDQLPERARCSHLTRSGLPAVYSKQIFTKSPITNPLLTKFVLSRWLDIGCVLFCEFMDLVSVSVHKHAKKERGQYPAILTEQTWLITHTYYSFKIFPRF